MINIEELKMVERLIKAVTPVVESKIEKPEAKGFVEIAGLLTNLLLLKNSANQIKHSTASVADKPLELQKTDLLKATEENIAMKRAEINRRQRKERDMRVDMLDIQMPQARRIAKS